MKVLCVVLLCLLFALNGEAALCNCFPPDTVPLVIEESLCAGLSGRCEPLGDTSAPTAAPATGAPFLVSQPDGGASFLVHAYLSDTVATLKANILVLQPQLAPATSFYIVYSDINDIVELRGHVLQDARTLESYGIIRYDFLDIQLRDSNTCCCWTSGASECLPEVPKGQCTAAPGGYCNPTVCYGFSASSPLEVDVSTLAVLLANWGPCTETSLMVHGTECVADVDRSGVIDVADLAEILVQWGPLLDANNDGVDDGCL